MTLSSKSLSSRILVIFVSVLMAVGTMATPFSGFAENAYAESTHNADSWAKLDKLIKSDAVKSGDTIEITQNIVADSSVGTIYLQKKNITIKGSGNGVTIYRDPNGADFPMFTVNAQNELKLGDKLTLSGQMGCLSDIEEITDVYLSMGGKYFTAVRNGYVGYNMEAAASTGNKCEILLNGHILCWNEHSKRMEYACNTGVKGQIQLKDNDGLDPIEVRDSEGKVATNGLVPGKKYVLYDTRWGEYITGKGTSSKDINAALESFPIIAVDPNNPNPSTTTTTVVGQKCDACVDKDNNAICATYATTADPDNNIHKFSSGTADAPKGFFVQVNDGKFTLAGAKLKDFVTDGTVKYAAPVVVTGNKGEFNFSDGEISHNSVGYTADNSKSTEISENIGLENENHDYEEKPETLLREWANTETAGAAILTNGAKATMTGGLIQENRGDTGAIVVQGKPDKAANTEKGTTHMTTLKMMGGTIDNNAGVHHAGAIYVYNGGSLQMGEKDNSGTALIKNNFAWNKGGAIWVSEEVYASSTFRRSVNDPGVPCDPVGEAHFYMYGGKIEGNMAINRGGGINVMSNHVALLGGEIKDNVSRALGGGVYVEGDAGRMYRLYVANGSITNNAAGNPKGNGEYAKKIRKVFNTTTSDPANKCEFKNNITASNATVADANQANGWNTGFHGAYGNGGGVWLCAFGGNATLALEGDKDVVINSNNKVNPGKGQDIFATTQGPGGNGVLILDQGRNNFIVEGTQKGLQTNTVYPGSLALKENSAIAPVHQGGVKITGNVASNGGGIAANGTVLFGQDVDVYRATTALRITKDWEQGVQKKPVTLKLQLLDDDDNPLLVDGKNPLEAYKVTLDGTADVVDDPNVVAYEVNTSNTVNGWTAEMALPLTIVDDNGMKRRVVVFEMEDGTILDPSNASDLETIYTNLKNNVKFWENARLDANIKVLEVVDGAEQNPAIITPLVVDESNTKISSSTTSEYTDIDGKPVGSYSVFVTNLGFSYGVKNVAEDKPQIEKYINNQVHKTVDSFNEVFEYSVMAYVPKNATEIVISDTLEDSLMFVDAFGNKQYKADGTANEEFNKSGRLTYANQSMVDNSGARSYQLLWTDDGAANETVGDGTGLVANLATDASHHVNGPITAKGDYIKISENGKTLSVKIDQATGIDSVRGKNVILRFKAAYNPNYHEISKIREHSSWKEITEDTSTIDKDGKAADKDSTDADYSGVKDGADVETDKSHTGTANQAEYTIKTGNAADVTYKSNTVTVRPGVTDFKVSKIWVGDKKDEDTLKANIHLYAGADNKDVTETHKDKLTITGTDTNSWTLTWKNLPELESGEYYVKETGISGFQAPVYTNASNDSATDKAYNNGVITNTETPEDYSVEKYINNKVHEGPIPFDRSFEYEIMAYVPKDATEVKITDKLAGPLEFAYIYGDNDRCVPDNGVQFYAKDRNNHIGDGVNGTVTATTDETSDKYRFWDHPQATIGTPASGPDYDVVVDDDNKTITLTIGKDYLDKVRRANHDGHKPGEGFWVRLAYQAKYSEDIYKFDGTNGYQSALTEVKKAENGWLNDAADKNGGNANAGWDNGSLKDATRTHHGTSNQAEYNIKRNGETEYITDNEKKTNIVTVEPEMVTYQVKKQWKSANGQNIMWPTGAKINITLSWVPNSGSQVNVWTRSFGTSDVVPVENLPKLENGRYVFSEKVAVEPQGTYSNLEQPKDAVEDEVVVFANTKNQKKKNPVAIEFVVNKSVEYGQVSDYNPFEFVLTETSADPQRSVTKTNNSSGQAYFSGALDLLSFEDEDVHTFTLKEKTGNQDVVYDTKTVNIEVKAKKNETATEINYVIDYVKVDGVDRTADFTGSSTMPSTIYTANSTAIENLWIKNEPVNKYYSYTYGIRLGGHVAYCMDIGKYFNTNTTYNLQQGSGSTAPFSDLAKLKKVMYYGYPKVKQFDGYSEDETRLATQMAIWYMTCSDAPGFETVKKKHPTIWNLVQTKLFNPELPEVPQDFNLTPYVYRGGSNDQPVVIFLTGDEKPITAAFVNKKKFDVEISKTDLGGNEIADATIKVSKATKNGEEYTVGDEVETWTSVEGSSHTLKLLPGYYVMEETDEPDGYDKVDTKIYFEVKEDGTVELITTEVDDDNEVTQDPQTGKIILKDAPAKGPEIEKYVNNQVHKELVEFDRTFEYEILAYVPKGATRVVIEDVLVKDLEFNGTINNNGTTNDIGYTIYAGEVDHTVNGSVSDANFAAPTAGYPPTKKVETVKVDGIDRQKISVTIGTNAGIAQVNSGKWVKLTIPVKIKASSYDELLKKLNGEPSDVDDSWVEFTETINNSQNAEGKVLQAADKQDANYGDHKGLANKASYKVSFGNDYTTERETNTVTVKPDYEQLEVEKVWKNVDGETIPWPNGVSSVNVKVKNCNELVDTIVIKKPESGNGPYKGTSKKLKKLTGVTYTLEEVPVAGFASSISSKVVTNKQKDTPEIAKYVNKDVHEDIAFDQNFAYDILAYVTKDADELVIEDTLNGDLAPDGAASTVRVFDMGADQPNLAPNGTVSQHGSEIILAAQEDQVYRYLTINGQKLTVTINDENGLKRSNENIKVEDLRGHWIRVNFQAKLKDEIVTAVKNGTKTPEKAIEDLSKTQVTKGVVLPEDESAQVRHEAKKGNEPVVTDENHNGVPNTARYEIKVGNESRYFDKSNTVTVIPEAEKVYVKKAYENKNYTSWPVKIDVRNNEGTVVDTITVNNADEIGESKSLPKLVKGYNVIEQVPTGFSQVGDASGNGTSSDPFVITNKLSKEPTVEKYVENKVHADIINFDEIFTYEVLAFVPRGSKRAHIEDTLVSDLEFYGENGSATLTILGTDNDHKVNGSVTGNGKSFTVNQAQGMGAPVVVADEDTNKITADIGDGTGIMQVQDKWVKLTFRAKIKETSYGPLLEKLKGKNSNVSWKEISGTANEPVLQNDAQGKQDANYAQHSGIDNQAKFKISFENEGESWCDPIPTNVVTVKPETTKVNAKKTWKVGDKVLAANEWPEGEKVTFGIFSKKGDAAAVPVVGTVTDKKYAKSGNAQATFELDKDNQTMTVTELPKLQGVTYSVKEVSVTKGNVTKAVDYTEGGNAGSAIADAIEYIVKMIKEGEGDAAVYTALNSKPSIEKYVNKNVHKDLEAFDTAFEYDVMAYVPEGATKIVITDELKPQLVKNYADDDAAKTAIANSAVIKNNNDHTVNGSVNATPNGSVELTADDVAIDGNKITITVDNIGEADGQRNLGGKWVQATIKAKLNPDYYNQIQEQLAKGETGCLEANGSINWAKVEDDGQVQGGVDSHSGIVNKASYKVYVDNDYTSDYETNEVTVKPQVVNTWVKKAWTGIQGTWPTDVESIKFTVTYGNGSKSTSQEITLTKDEPAKKSQDFAKLEGGQFTVTEETLTAYEQTGEVAGKGTEDEPLTITNAPKKTKVPVTKVWSDANDQDGKRPDSIKVQLKADGKAEGEPVTLNEENSWAHTWTELPEKAKGKAIAYTVEEVEVPEGYQVAYGGDATTGFIVTNTYNPENIDIPVEKVWDDADDQDGLRELSVTVSLKADGEVKDTVTLDESNKWKHTFTNLPKKANGKDINYTVEEVKTKVINGKDEAGHYAIDVSGSIAQGFTITNKHTPETTEVKVKKTWNLRGGNNWPADTTVKFALFKKVGDADAEEAGTVELSATKATHTFDNLPKYKDGQAITYTAREVSVTGPDGKEIEINAAGQAIADIIKYICQMTGDVTSEFEATNSMQVKVPISKQDITDDSGAELPGAEITVTGNGVNETRTSTDKPHELWLEPGDYEMVEDTAPTGFQRVETTIKFTVNEDGTVTLTEAVAEPAGAVVYENGVLIIKDAPVEEPQTEKYVNKDVTYNFENFDQTFEYQVMAYITNDGKKVTITDTLVDALQFVGDGDIKVFDMGTENNHSIAEGNDDATVAQAGTEFTPDHAYITDDGRTMKVIIDDAKNVTINGESGSLQGHWIKVTFKAQIDPEKYSIVEAFLAEKAKEGTATDDDIWKNVGGDENGLVLTKKEHDGVLNKATYALTTYNDGEYEEETNPVTVEPETTKVKVKKEWNVSEWPEGTTVTFGVFKKTGDEVADKPVKTVELNAEKKTAEVDGLPKLDGVTYIAREMSVTKDGKSVDVDYTDEGKTAGEAIADAIRYVVKITAGVEDEVATFTAKNTKQYKVPVSKQDITDGSKELPGAVITVNGETMEEPETWTSTDTPHELWLEPGDYTMTEDVAPEGFQRVTTTIEFNVDEDGNVTMTNADVKPEEAKVVAENGTIILSDAPKPTSEKYVNNDVTWDFKNFDQTIEYEIMAYVTYDGVKLTVTDDLVEALQFVGDGNINVYDMGKDNDHKDTVKSDGKAITPDKAEAQDRHLEVVISDKDTIESIRGHWIKVTFDAQINPEKYNEVKALLDDKAKNGTIGGADDEWADEWMNVTDNGTVKITEKHDGIPNKAKFVLECDNDGKYEEETNPVTVEPETIKTKVQKKWAGIQGDWPKDAKGNNVKVKFIVKYADNDPEEIILDSNDAVSTKTYARVDGGQFDVTEVVPRGYTASNDGKAEYDEEAKAWTITNTRGETPGPEKYVNNDVTWDYENFNQVVEYEIMAYITNDGKTMTITDNLVPALQFVPGENDSTGANIKVYDMGEGLDANDHKTSVKGEGKLITLDTPHKDVAKAAGQELIVKIADAEKVKINGEDASLQNHWIKVTFNAQIRPSAYKKVKEYLDTKAAGGTIDNNDSEWMTITDNGNVKIDTFNHDGVPNKARFVLECENNPTYEEDTNTVTVEPKTTKARIEKKWKNTEGQDIKWPDEIESIKITVKYGDNKAEEFILDKDNVVAETETYARVEGATFAINEDAIPYFTMSIDADSQNTDEQTDAFIVTNNEVQKPVIPATRAIAGDVPASENGPAIISLGAYDKVNIEVQDEVELKGLKEGNNYYVESELVKKGSGPVDRVKTKVDHTMSSVTVDFKKNITEVGSYYVVTELWKNGELVFIHNEDGEDPAECINVSKVDAEDRGMGTTASVITPGGEVAATADHVATIEPNEDGTVTTTVNDTIEYFGLTPNATYLVTGTLLQVVPNDEEEMVPVKTIKTVENVELVASETGEGTWEMSFGEVDLKAGNRYVVYETAVNKDQNVEGDVAGHEDPGAISQAVVVSEVEPEEEEPKPIKITKTDLGGKELAGATILVTGPNGFSEEWVSTTKPHELKLLAGEYEMREVVAPVGYSQVTTTIRFAVDEEGNVELLNAESIVGGKVDYMDKDHIVLMDAPVLGVEEEPDKPTDKVKPSESNPKKGSGTYTGDESPLALALMLLLMAGAAGGGIFGARRRKSNQ